MNDTYWNSLNKNYKDQVLEIANQDLNGTLVSEIEKIANSSRTAADLGCGPGSLLPLLAPRFKSVYAVDFAQALLDKAKKRYSFSNIQYIRHDLFGQTPLKFKVDVAFCINALINPSYEKRFKMALNVKRTLNSNGTAIFVVPAFESMINTYKTLIHLEHANANARTNTVEELEKIYAKEVISSIEGIVDIGGTPTKTFTCEGLRLFMSDVGLKIKKICRVEYDWNEELDNPPKNLNSPYPWDWLILVTK